MGADTDSPIYFDGLDDLEAAFATSRRELIPGQRHIGHVFAPEAVAELVAGFCGNP